MVRAIFGCLLIVTGVLFGAQQFVAPGSNLWIAAVVVLTGLCYLLRGPSRTVVAAGEDSCLTCHGAGTVYSDEYNDWRRTGPIRTIRDLCPACEGSGSPGLTAGERVS